MAEDNQFGFYRDIQLNNGALVVTGITGGGGSGTSGTSGAAGTSGTNGTSGTAGTSGTSPGGGGFVSGSHFNYTMTPGRTYNLATGGVYEQNGLEANSIWAFPFTPGRNITISAMTFDAFSSSAEGEMKLLAYTNNDALGIPGTLVIESTAISLASAGMKQYNVTYTFSAGTTYWLAVAANSTGNVQGRGISQYNAFPFGVPDSSGNNVIYTLARSYTLSWPTIPSTFTLNDLASARIPEVRFKVSA